MQAFTDLRTAGPSLATALQAVPVDRDAIVLGIVRAGVPAAVEVARTLDLPLDLVLLRALLYHASGDLLRAVSVAGALVLDERCGALPPDSVARTFVDEAVSELAARAALCRGPRPPASLEGRTLVVIDSGMRTGRTMAAAVGAARSLAPRRIVAAVPVATADALTLVERLVDRIDCLWTPATLGNVAMAYRRYDVPADAGIRGLLAEVRSEK